MGRLARQHPWVCPRAPVHAARWQPGQGHRTPATARRAHSTPAAWQSCACACASWGPRPSRGGWRTRRRRRHRPAQVADASTRVRTGRPTGRRAGWAPPERGPVGPCEGGAGACGACILPPPNSPRNGRGRTRARGGSHRSRAASARALARDANAREGQRRSPVRRAPASPAFIVRRPEAGAMRGGAFTAGWRHARRGRRRRPAPPPAPPARGRRRRGPRSHPGRGPERAPVRRERPLARPARPASPRQRS